MLQEDGQKHGVVRRRRRAAGGRRRARLSECACHSDEDGEDRGGAQSRRPAPLSLQWTFSSPLKIGFRLHGARGDSAFNSRPCETMAKAARRQKSALIVVSRNRMHGSPGRHREPSAAIRRLRFRRRHGWKRELARLCRSCGADSMMHAGRYDASRPVSSALRCCSRDRYRATRSATASTDTRAASGLEGPLQDEDGEASTPPRTAALAGAPLGLAAE